MEKENLKTQKTVVLVGFYFDPYVENVEAKPAGPVRKPFQKKELLERIRFQLKLSQKARQTQRANRITDTPKDRPLGQNPQKKSSKRSIAHCQVSTWL